MSVLLFFLTQSIHNVALADLSLLRTDYKHGDPTWPAAYFDQTIHSSASITVSGSYSKEFPIRFGESWYSYSLKTNVDMNLDFFFCLLFYFLTAHDFQNSTLKNILLCHVKVDDIEIWEQKITVNILRSDVLNSVLTNKTCDLLISGLVFTTSTYLGLEVTPPFLHVPHGLLPSKVYNLHH